MIDYMDWYKSLSIHQRINLKKIADIITGLTWAELGVFFTLADRIKIIHKSLINNGFEI